MVSGGIPDMSALLEQAQRLQQQLVSANEELANTRVDGLAGDGLVTATVTGTGELVRVTIKPEACDPADAETLGDLVVAAVRQATSKASELAGERMGPLAGGLDLLAGDRPNESGGGPAGFALPPA